jgi:hypothetical protein
MLDVAVPGQHLLHIDGEVGVGEHRTLGHARGAAGILQQGDVFLRFDYGRLEAPVIVDEAVPGDAALGDAEAPAMSEFAALEQPGTASP